MINRRRYHRNNIIFVIYYGNILIFTLIKDLPSYE